MQLSQTEREQLYAILEQYDHHPKVQEMREFIQHGDVTTYHKTSSFHGIRRLFEMHGFSHPGSACVNAEHYFHITKKEQDIIQSHMWPLTFRHVPTCREAIIVCLADKYCAVVESMFRRAKVATTVGADGADDTEW